MFRAMKLHQLEVINITDARRLGFVHDVEINESDGSVSALIVPKGKGFFGRLFNRGEYVILWEQIVAAGRDLVLVRIDNTVFPVSK